MGYLGPYGDSPENRDAPSASGATMSRRDHKFRRRSPDDDAAYRDPAKTDDSAPASHDESTQAIDDPTAAGVGDTPGDAEGDQSGDAAGDVTVLAVVLTAAVGCALTGFAIAGGSRPISYVAGIAALAAVPLVLMWGRAASAKRRSIAGMFAVAIVAVGLAVPWLTRSMPASPAWSVELTGAPSELIQTGTLVLYDDASGIVAIDAKTGELSWQVSDAQRIDFVSADGYVLATDTRSAPNRKLWISPSGHIEWSAEQSDGQWANGPTGHTDLDLTWPIAAKDGVLVVRQGSSDVAPGESEPPFHYIGLATDGSIAWTVDIPELMSIELARLDAEDPVASHVRALPTVGLVDVSDGPGGQVAAYDAATGSQVAAFDVGELYQPGSGEPLGVVVAGDDVVWQTYAGEFNSCDIHLRNLNDGSTWNVGQPCLGVGLQVANGWLTDWVSPYSEPRVFRAFSLKTGEAFGQPVSEFARPLFNDAGSQLTALNVNSERLVATEIGGEAEKWSVAAPDGTLLDAGYGDGVVAVAHVNRATKNPLVSQGDLPPSTIDVYDADSGEELDELPIGVRVHEVLPLAPTRFVVVSRNSIAVYDLGR